MSDSWKPHRSLQVQRDYPEDCPGTLMIVDRDDSVAIVECNLCDYAAGVPIRELEREAVW